MRRWREIGLVATATILVLSCALPWVQIGSRSRSSFSLLASVRRLGIIQSAWGRIALAGWPVVPLLGSTVIACVLLGYRRSAAVAGCILALATGALSVAVFQLPLPSLIGSRVALIGSLGMVLLSTTAWRRNNDEQ
jgi:hypothetical protein